MIRNALLTLASIFLIWQTYELIKIVPIMELNSWGVVVFVAWLVNLFITGIFAFAGFAFPTHKLLPRGYYHISKPETLTWWFNQLRVDMFRKLLLVTLWRGKNQRKRYFNGKKVGIQHLSEASKKSEFGHLIPFVLITIMSLYFLTLGNTALGLSSFAINIIGNLYPILLQRHHRLRIQRVFE